ncbi:MAG: vWA domain-containing protein, partial [Gammaproteobacteria bacterium]
ASNFDESTDRLALTKYSVGAEVPVPMEGDRGFSMADVRDGINGFNFRGRTNTPEGFYRGLNEIRSVSDPNDLRAVVLFTDGAPNAFAARFNLRSYPDTVGVIQAPMKDWDHCDRPPQGLWRADRLNTPGRRLDAKLCGDRQEGAGIIFQLDGLPEYYNADDALATEFPILNPTHPRRPVDDYNYRNANRDRLLIATHRIARNLPEDMAEVARKEGIYVFVIGLGYRLTQGNGPENEIGQDMLYRMANDPAMLDIPRLAGDFKPDQLQGIYCHAINRQVLGACFEKITETLLRLTI